MRKFFTKKKIVIGIILIVIIAIVGFFVVKSRNNTSATLTDTVKKQDLRLTVLATGQVTSSTDLNLSFKTSGIVQKINFAVGGKVKQGDIVAALDQKDAAASYTSARGSLAQAEASYQKVLDGASSQDVAVAQAVVDSAQVSLDNAKKSLDNSQQQQTVLVQNALASLLNSTPSATPASGNLGNATVTVSGTYNGTAQGTYTIKAYLSGNGPAYYVRGLESGGDQVKINVPMPLGTRGLSIQFSSTNVFADDSWIVEVPNTKASNYTTNLNAYNAALQSQQVALSAAQNVVSSAQASLDQAVASLGLKKAQARPADVAAAQAQILSAQGQVQAAAASLENTIIRSPSEGTVTSVDIKVGEQASPTKEAIIVQDVTNLHVEANVSEANVASIKPGQDVSFTFDALGPDRTFKGAVQTIDPASTVISGVVNYKVIASVDKLPEIKPGMTANMTILSATKAGVLAVPQRAVLSHDNKKFVRVVDDSKKKTYHEVEVTVGMDADGGLAEIVSGLNEGQEVVTFINTK